MFTYDYFNDDEEEEEIEEKIDYNKENREWLENQKV
jgi:hypothetical protein